jgi:hypothetical protein
MNARGAALAALMRDGALEARVSAGGRRAGTCVFTRRP